MLPSVPVHPCEAPPLKSCLNVDMRNLEYGERIEWGGFMQHPREAGRLRLVLLNMEKGHTAKAAGSF